ncbi:hypothetical protein FOA43_001573 [Brettanomyces nanus]|uniref:Tetratricopeptide repeat protein n=1 Tax=Eeniella nana TaxID=13502 RepID=A0A875RZU4_EENNA|nr:uncharacterized protein FOA43_001573 [Brettanomyces nanus]QPG74248.1 hypothetical protein FOA43_001573 [Brettanomyces nanus]
MSLPIAYDSVTKKVQLDENAKFDENRDLQLEIDQLNTLMKDYVSINSDVPPLPTPQSFTKNLSLMVKKMHTSATNLMKQGKFRDASKQYGIALGLAMARPKFENFQLTMSEAIICLIGRCDALIMDKDFLAAYQDAEILSQLAAGVPESHLRKGVCELKLGNALEAKADFERGLCFKPDHTKLQQHLKLAEDVIRKENGD